MNWIVFHVASGQSFFSGIILICLAAAPSLAASSLIRRISVLAFLIGAANQRDLKVQDVSHVGETAAAALKRVSSIEIDSPLVIVEIGGNDLLGITSSARFARDLDALLSALTASQRQIVMFELPLPPFCHEYGRIQRTLARKHGVALIPKRVLLSILAPSESTLDTIHFSQSGHQQMADCIWRVIGPALPH